MDDLLKEAIADAKAVRETALENAKIALEEAFTPRLQSMLSKKIQSEIEAEGAHEDDEDVEERMHDEDEDDMDEKMRLKADDEDPTDDASEGAHEDEDEYTGKMVQYCRHVALHSLQPLKRFLSPLARPPHLHYFLQHFYLYPEHLLPLAHLQ